MEVSDTPEGIGAIAPALDAKQQKLPFFDLFNINVFWLANNFHWQALLAVIIPSMVAHFLDPANKSINLAIVVSAGTFVAVVVNPLVGAASDYASFRMGRRRPFMIIGTIVNVVVLIVFAFSPFWFSSGALLLTFALLFLLLQISNNFANSPWSAIIADKVPIYQRGLASGFYGLFTLIGTILGSILAGIILGNGISSNSMLLYRNAVVEMFVIIAAVQIIFVAYTVITVKEVPLAPEKRGTFNLLHILKRFLFKPTQYPDLSWVLLARFLVTMGIWSVYYFLTYYFNDVLGGPGVRTILFNTRFTGEQFNGALFQPVIVLLALPTSLLAGWASDRWGRKGLVYLSGVMMAIVCAIFILFQNQPAALVGGAFFGIGYGAYTSVDWALTTDVLPPTNEAGKFMGIWSAVGILPQVVGLLIGGVLLQVLRSMPHHFGYTSLFILTIIYIVLGTIVIKQVKGAR